MQVKKSKSEKITKITKWMVKKSNDQQQKNKQHQQYVNETFILRLAPVNDCLCIFFESIGISIKYFASTSQDDSEQQPDELQEQETSAT